MAHNLFNNIRSNFAADGQGGSGSMAAGIGREIADADGFQFSVVLIVESITGDTDQVFRFRVFVFDEGFKDGDDNIREDDRDGFTLFCFKAAADDFLSVPVNHIRASYRYISSRG